MKKSTQLLLVLSVWLPLSLFAQKQDAVTIAKDYLESQKEKWQLTSNDLEDLIVSDQYQTKHNGVTHLYFVQRHKGIELYNGIAGVHLSADDKPFYATSRFLPNFAQAINTTSPTLSAEEAVWKAVQHLNIRSAKPLEVKERTATGAFIFTAPSISNSDIKVQLRYQKVNNTEARLAWDLAIDMLNSADYWSLRIDALTGELLDKGNYTVYCQHDHAAGGAQCNQFNYDSWNANAFELPVDNTVAATYNVFPFPLESPVHGDRQRQFVTDPADPIASPYGWHDTNGQEGPEYRITRGNNVHAFQDRNATNQSQGDEPEGDSTLVFDFYFDPNVEPGEYTDFATVQLFYANNYIHDFTYAYGFDERAGNFQQNNYERGGTGNDYVRAQAQDGDGTNNANFATPPDGGSGSMQMFLWNSSSGSVTVSAPGSIAGIYETRAAQFGTEIDTIPVSGEAVLVNDGSGAASLGCNPLINDLTGKIAIIDRGGCFFSQKVYNAEQAGAVGAIICNFDGGAFSGMSAGTDDVITIPSVMVDYTDCVQLKQFIGQGLVIDLVLPNTEGPSQVDGTLDNGIVAHEYGHGISNRLTGGPNSAGCLFNDEQMGEGWSDFFTLVTTVRSADISERRRTVGAFAQQQDPNGSGIRRSPYSPDFSVNSQVYHDIIATTSPHGLGEVWVATLWELYWAMVDEYGFDEDVINGTGGNNMAIQLVMDGMKLQECNPGLIDGRNGILAADMANNQGANQCIIWKVFSNRGLGFEASQRFNNSRNDGKQDFNTRPDCIKELKIAKTVTPVITAGELIEVQLTVTNHKDSLVTLVDFRDQLPEGTSFHAFTSVPEGVQTVNTDDDVQFRALTLESGESITVSYQLATDAGLYSIQQFKDDMEDGDNNWDFFPLSEEAYLIWEIVEEIGVDGSAAWIVGPTPDVAQDQIFQLIDPIEVSGDQPVLRFTHLYQTDWAFDGGLIEVSTDNFQWQTVGEKFFRNGYETRLDYQTISIPKLEVFSGDVYNEFRTSYIDLSDFVGEELNMRFRFAADTADTYGESYAWIVDDIEIMDMFNYNSEACVTSDEGDMACTVAAEKGTIVDSEFTVDTKEVEIDNNLKLFPNPTSDFVHLTFESTQTEKLVLSILGADGKLHLQENHQVQAGYNYMPLEISNLAAGFYFVQLEGDFGKVVQKLVIE